jgi:hypothetical protein
MGRHTSRFRFALLVALCIVLAAQYGARAAAQPTDGLKFFDNFFVTGDYVVGGVGLWNNGAGQINVSGAPENADALAAFLYWQVVTSADPTVVDVNAGATFNGTPLNVPLGVQLKPTTRGVTVGTNACLLNGGSSKKVHTFRADVLSLLDSDANGRRVINHAYPVDLPDSSDFRTLGASLVVIYRNPDPAASLNSIVIYDGTFVKQQSATFAQRIEGFYDPASVQGKVTYIAGSAQGNLRERLSGPFTQQTNAFAATSGNAWDNVTLTTNSLAGATYFDTQIAPYTTGILGSLQNDCVAVGSVIFRSAVNDADLDGLLDRWESSTNASPIYDPRGVALPPLADMGALPGRKDIFIEVGAMQAAAGTTYGSTEFPLSKTVESVTDAFGHIHMPTPVALKDLGDTFLAKNILLHFDVGDPATYHSLVSPGLPLGEPNPFASLAADNYIVGAGGLSGSNPALARGGELFDETACEPGLVDHDNNSSTPDVIVDCQYPEFPGTVSWKDGFMLYKEQAFDAARKDVFRYGFYAHAKASPKSLLPCLGDAGAQAGLNASGDCFSGEPNALFHVPAGVSGSGEYPGGDFLITLGLWDNIKFVGTDFAVAGTSMHEIGHTLDLGHGGEALPNCKPNYLSVMNYLFQLNGLMDANGDAHLGYSELDLLDINENSATDGYNVPGPYRTSWYRPVALDHPNAPKRYCNGLTIPDGAPKSIRADGNVGVNIDWDLDGTNDSGPQDVNFDGEPDAVPGGTTTLTGYDDWSNLRLNQLGSSRGFGGQSIGSGVRLLSDGSQLLADGSVLLADGSRLLADGSVLLADGSRLLADGAKLLADGSVLLADGSVLLADGVRLLSDGSRLLADGSKLLADGSKLLADGAKLLADGSVLLADGSVLLADGAVFLADGVVLLGDGVQLLSDGSVLMDSGSPLLADGASPWELTESTPTSIIESGTLPGATSLRACVIGGTGVSACVPADNAPAGPLHRVWLTWKAPAALNVDYTEVYRVTGEVVDGSEAVVEIAGAAAQSIVADEELPNGVKFTYFVRAYVNGGTQTPDSNARTITAENDPPVAGGGDPDVVADTYSTTKNIALTVAGPGLLANDDAGADSGLAALAVVPVLAPGATTAQGGKVVLNANGSFTYTPPTNFVGTDTFTYQVTNGPWPANTGVPLSTASNTATVTITVVAPPLTLKFYRADMWLSTSSSNRKYDLKAEVLKNGTAILVSKEVFNQTLGFGTTFNKAVYRAIGDFPSTFFDLTETDTLSLRVSIKVSTSSAGGNNASGAIRLWYNVPTTPSSASKDSHLHARRNGTDVRYYLISPSALQRDGIVAGPTQSIDAVVYKTGYTTLGTWSVTGP